MSSVVCDVSNELFDTINLFKLSDYAKGFIHKEKEIYLEIRLLLVLQL
ncbi:Uncharacterized protein APZ42_007244 [Daphnia magna]|uniref:Uncharacterized protein n=1 Tax=Daphnia magna TaxID=35525 RepID=A0A164FEP6_9CRUS|nr:Uncharacterized protein APZ42_007244 [Daphnia magna]